MDDEEKTVEVLQVHLKKEGYQVLCAYDDITAMKLFKENEASLILLGLTLLDTMGKQIRRSIRTVSHVPVIMLTARTEEAGLINGPQMGADDYIFKPFSPRTMVAKIGVVLRRTKGDELISLSVSYSQGKLVIDFSNMIMKVQGKEIGLTPMRLKILTTMTKVPNRIFTREQPITYALNDGFDSRDRSIDTYIKGVRSKIEDDRRYPSYIFTVHGLGYKFARETG